MITTLVARAFDDIASARKLANSRRPANDMPLTTASIDAEARIAAMGLAVSVASGATTISEAEEIIGDARYDDTRYGMVFRNTFVKAAYVLITG